MMKFFKGYSSESELNSAISKLLSLDTYPKGKLAKSRWVFPEGMMNRLFKTIRGLEACRKSLKSQESLLRNIPTPLVVVGDLHGDMYTLIEMIKHHGLPPRTNYLFLGDYVDRGPNGMETFLLPLILMARFPGNAFCLRGNHESVMMSRSYGFLEECRHRYSTRIYLGALKCFDLLPVAGIVGGKIFAVHGGISPHMDSLQDIASIQRPAKLQPGTLLTDVIWGDPTKEPLDEDFVPSDRGAGFLFGEEPCKRFLLDNGFVAMVRAHEVVAKGVRVHFGCCWTVFSHPRYMGLRNVAATLVITDDLDFVPHYFPYEIKDLEDLEFQPLAAEDETEPPMGLRTEESVIGDWEAEDNESFEEEGLGEGSGSFTEDFSTPTETPSINGTESSSQSNGMSPQGSSPTCLTPAQALGVTVAR